MHCYSFVPMIKYCRSAFLKSHGYFRTLYNASAVPASMINVVWYFYHSGVFSSRNFGRKVWNKW